MTKRSHHGKCCHQEQEKEIILVFRWVCSDEQFGERKVKNSKCSKMKTAILPLELVKFKIFVRNSQSRCGPETGGLAQVPWGFSLQPLSVYGGWLWLHHYYIKSSHRAFNVTCFDLSVIFICISCHRTEDFDNTYATSWKHCRSLVPSPTETELSHHRKV